MEIKEELLDIEGIGRSNKPLIDLFIRRTAVLTSTPEWLAEKIIKDQWKNANKQTQADCQVSEIDFANLGTLFISPSKARKRIVRQEKHYNELVTKGPSTDKRAEKRRQLQMDICQESIKAIKFKTKQS